MPNYVTNKIDFYGDDEDIKAVMDIIKGKDERTRAIDFDRLIPMPDNLGVGCGSDAEYDWHCNHWGTKWNAYNQSVESNTSISFDTAWSIPEPILQKLTVICNEHNVWFEGQFISEDWRQCSGWYASLDDVLNVCYDETENEGAERAKAVWGCDPREDEE